MLFSIAPEKSAIFKDGAYQYSSMFAQFVTKRAKQGPVKGFKQGAKGIQTENWR